MYVTTYVTMHVTVYVTMYVTMHVTMYVTVYISLSEDNTFVKKSHNIPSQFGSCNKLTSILMTRDDAEGDTDRATM